MNPLINTDDPGQGVESTPDSTSLNHLVITTAKAIETVLTIKNSPPVIFAQHNLNHDMSGRIVASPSPDGQQNDLELSNVHHFGTASIPQNNRADSAYSDDDILKPVLKSESDVDMRTPIEKKTEKETLSVDLASQVGEISSATGNAVLRRRSTARKSIRCPLDPNVPFEDLFDAQIEKALEKIHVDDSNQVDTRIDPKKTKKLIRRISLPIPPVYNEKDLVCDSDKNTQDVTVARTFSYKRSCFESEDVIEKSLKSHQRLISSLSRTHSKPSAHSSSKASASSTAKSKRKGLSRRKTINVIIPPSQSIISSKRHDHGRSRERQHRRKSLLFLEAWNHPSRDAKKKQSTNPWKFFLLRNQHPLKRFIFSFGQRSKTLARRASRIVLNPLQSWSTSASTTLERAKKKEMDEYGISLESRDMEKEMNDLLMRLKNDPVAFSTASLVASGIVTGKIDPLNMVSCTDIINSYFQEEDAIHDPYCQGQEEMTPTARWSTNLLTLMRQESDFDRLIQRLELENILQ